jgi:hypothetical protein
MIISSPYVIILSADEQHELIGRARGARAAHRDVVRARSILTAAEGVANARIAADLGLHIDTVRKWRRRFYQRRSGRPAPVGAAPPVQRRPGCGGEGVGVRAAGRVRCSAGEVELP